MLNNLQTLINNCSVKNTSIGLACEQRKIYTEKLGQLFTDARYILKFQMDKTDLYFETANPVFYGLYKEARNIYEHKGKRDAKESPEKTTAAS